MTERWNNHPHRKKKVLKKAPKVIEEEVAIKEILREFKLMVRLLVSNSNDALAETVFLQNKAANAGGLANFGIQGHHPSIRMRPILDKAVEVQVSVAILRIKGGIPTKQKPITKANWKETTLKTFGRR